MENYQNFGGRNKARRLARLIRKGKGDSARAKRLTKKVQAKVDKLAEKGKTNKKRYKFITEKLRDTNVLTIKEMEDLDETEDKVLEGDDELTNEIDEEIADTVDDTKIKHDKWIPKVPNWVTITGTIVLLVVGLGIAFRKKIFKK